MSEDGLQLLERRELFQGQSDGFAKAVEIVFTPLLLGVVGHFLDGWLGTGPVLTVVLAAWTGGYGNYTCLDHGGGLATCYAHQSSYAVSAGAQVTQGQVIGYVGSTGHSFGAHLHFEVRINGNPVDPLGYL